AADQPGLTLRRDKPAYRKDLGGSGPSGAIGRFECPDVDPAVHHVKLVPVFGADERHELASPVLADASDEARELDLLRQSVLPDVEELGGPVHGEAPRPLLAAEVRSEEGDVRGHIRVVGVDVADAAAHA